jgi:hypothetical protein
VPKKNGPSTPLYRIGIWVCALAPATLVTVAVQSFQFNLSPRATLAIILGSWIASSFAMNWAMFERATELKTKYPISSKELRRRTKEFYDSLNH